MSWRLFGRRTYSCQSMINAVLDIIPAALRRWRSLVVIALALFNLVNRHRARSLLGWVTVCGQISQPPRSIQPTLRGTVKWASAFGWVIINGYGECSLLVVMQAILAQVDWFGPEIHSDGRHSSREWGELSQCFEQDDSWHSGVPRRGLWG